LLFISVILYTTAHKSWIRLCYEINKMEIIEKFCVNKAETTFSCEGKCHLKTQLNRAEKSKGEQDMQITEESRFLLFTQTKTDLPGETESSHSTGLSNYSNLYYYLYPSSIFHPPKRSTFS